MTSAPTPEPLHRSAGPGAAVGPDGAGPRHVVDSAPTGAGVASGRGAVASLGAAPHGRSVRVLGIVNVTPDSFSDGGRWAATTAAIAHGLELRAAGADLVDVGGESTRPGAARVDESVELARVLPVIAELAAAGVPCSVDTTRATVAAAAVAAGARLVNDVSGGRQDPDMARTVADLGVPWVLMHWRAPSLVMAEHAVYGDVVRDVLDELLTQVDLAVAAGVPADRLVLDPGLGFAKTAAHNWTLLARLPRLVATGLPVLVGASRKRFLPPSDAAPGSAADLAARDLETSVITAAVARDGAWGVRVHDVAGSVRAAQVQYRLDHDREEGPTGPPPNNGDVHG